MTAATPKPPPIPPGAPAPKPRRPRFVLTLEAGPSDIDPVIRLRQALKSLGRRFDLRCVSVEEIGGHPVRVNPDLDASRHEPPF